MNWINPVQDLGNRVQAPVCTYEACTSTHWQRWRRRNQGVFLNGKWLCSEECMAGTMGSLLSHNRGTRPKNYPSAYRLPLGLMMLSRGAIGEHDLASALAMKSKYPEKRIGECLRQLGVTNDEEITRALGAQSCLPVLLGYEPEIEDIAPLRLQQESEVFCFRSRYNPSLMYAGFAAAADQPLIRAIESVLDVAVEACILPTKTVRSKLSMLEEHKVPELIFEARMPAGEIVRSICSYTRQSGSEWIRMANTRRYLWVRLKGQTTHDLLFRHPETY